ncbi:MAG: cytochrome b/b6 domain-containing protein [Candidatus Hydrogenedentes bacterium]|nr:cytochrome b/b6 domain-containing protein [Candidatus Hydrogenedentota bacterium]
MREGPRTTMRIHAIPLICAFVAILGLLPQCADAVEDADCFMCHNDPAAMGTDANGEPIHVYIDEEVYSASSHGPIGCIACHADIVELPHPDVLKPVDCGTCHEETQQYAESLHGIVLSEGDRAVSGCADCHGIHDTRPSTDPLSKTNKRNLQETCGKCHSDPAIVKSHMISVSNPSESYLKSVHARALFEEGNESAASCSDCHGTHEMHPSQDPRSPVNRFNISATCGKCHADIVAEYALSIHGRALEAGIKDSPTCIDCHGEHDIEPPSSGTSPVSRQIVSQSTCPRCHDDERVMERYGVVTMRQASYMDSYHGLASAAGSTVVASCASCHGSHSILPASDPASSINPENLPNTCGQCHENAGPNFADGPVHIIPTDPGQRALGIVRLVYLWLIGIILGGMVVHNTLLMARPSLSKLWIEMGEVGTRQRFSKGHTIGHMVLTISFIALAISGFALRYPDTWWAKAFFLNSEDLAIRGTIHRVAGVILVILTVWNVFYSIFFRSGRRDLVKLILTWKDVKDVFHNMGWAVGLCKEKPKFDRYSYSEKFEYWGLWWGSVLMIVTGYAMWYGGWFLQYFPKYVLDIAALIHFYEAWLACGTIVIWHMYYMIFDPETYPMNWSWITGKITEEDMRERHPLEYEDVVLSEQKEEGSSAK